ncbi:hypothetical protein VHEMI04523 [[Torrubiella] hemipterigena]|nr:hypothetical protein VHEMI04523 [[Torrubiella] hemipterigena]
MESHSVVPRACHNCRVRKIRCNRECPCSNCLTSNISCRPGSRTAGGTTVVPSTTTSSSNNFRILHERLVRLENALENLSTTSQPSTTVATSSTVSPPLQISEAVDTVDVQKLAWLDTPTCVEREPSFERQTFMVSQIPELSVSGAATSPTVASELQTLTKAASSQNEPKPRIGRTLATPSVQMQRIPADFVLQVIRVLNASPCLLVLLHPLLDLELVKSLCQRLYFPVDALSVSEMTLFNGMLFFALWELQVRDDHDLDAQTIASYKTISEANFRTGLEVAEIAAVATYENTLTLSFAAYYAQTSGDLAHHKAFVTAAARHCILLGYHRHDKGQYSSVDVEKYRQLFWHTYVSDLGLTLRIGCAPAIEDYTVDVPLPAMSTDPQQSPWDQSLRAFINFSRIQARIYKKIYSPRATRLSTVDRKRKVADLALELEQWYAEWVNIDFAKAYFSDIYRDLFMAVDVIYYSVLTLLHRGSTTSNLPADISTECFAAARQGVSAHLRIFPKVSAGGRDAVYYYGVW